MCLQGRGKNVSDVIFPFTYSLSDYGCYFIMNHDTLDVSGPGPALNLLNLQMGILDWTLKT